MIRRDKRTTESRRAYKHAYSIVYRQKNKQILSIKNAKYRKLNKDKIKAKRLVRRPIDYARTKEYTKKNFVVLQIKRKQKSSELKTIVLTYYGRTHQLLCNLCDESRLEALTIDHIDGSGGQQRKLNGMKGKQLYAWLIRNGFPDGFRTLCSNCNWLTHLTRVRASQSQTASAKKRRKYLYNLKLRFMNAIGGCCVKCQIFDIDVLTCHHTNNDGSEHRKQIDSSCGVFFYTIILKSGDFTGLECRCFSCNDAEEWAN